MHNYFLVILIGFLFAGLAVCRPAQSDDEAVDEGRRALRKTNEYPWYSREKDSVRRINVAPREPATDEDEPREGRERDLIEPSSMTTLASVVLYSLIVLLICALAAFIVWLVVRAVNQGVTDEATRSVQTVSSTVDRVDDLPFRVRRPQSDLLAEARRHYEQGDYREAIIYLFSYMLIQLDKNQLIRLTKGKTNRQYLREVAPRPRLSGVVATTMVAFEDVFFGDHDLRREEFETCWRSLEDFHESMTEAVPV